MAKETADQAKAQKDQAKKAYRDAAGSAREKNKTKVRELRTAFQQAKHMQKYHLASFELAEFRLSYWLRNWRQESAKPHEAASQKTKKPQKPSPAAAKKSAPKTAKPAAKKA